MSEPPLTRLLYRLADLVWFRPWHVLGLTALVTLFLGYYAATVRIDSSFLGVLDNDDPAARLLAEVSQDFHAASSVVLVITGGTEKQRREAAMDAQSVLAPLPEVIDANAQVSPELLAMIGPMMLDDAQFEQLKVGLEGLAAVAPPPDAGHGLVGILRDIRGRLGGRRNLQDAPPEAAQAISALTAFVDMVGALPQDDARVWDELLSHAPAVDLMGPGGVPLRRGFVAGAEGSVYAVDVRTSLDPLATDVGLAGFSHLEQAIDPLRKRYPTLKMRFAGLLPGGYEDQSNVLGKVLPLSTITLLVVVLALVTLDRGFVTMLGAGSCLLIAITWTFGLVHLIFGYASLMASAVATMLFGLGIDFAAHITVRYNDERIAGVEAHAALRRAIGNTGRGVVVGGVTTVVSFALMVLTDFKAATHLGIAAAVGLSSALILMLSTFPAIVRIFDRREVRPPLALNLAWMDKLVTACLANPRRVLAFTALILSASLAMLPRFELETDLKKIITQDLPALAAADDLARAFGGSAEAILSVNDSVEQSRQRAAELVKLPQVARVDGIHMLIPPDADARAKRNHSLQPILDQFVFAPHTPGGPVSAAEMVDELNALAALGSKITVGAGLAGRHDIAEQGLALRLAAARAAEQVAGQDARLAATEDAFFRVAEGTIAALRRSVALESFGPDQLPEEVLTRYASKGRYVSFVYPADYRIQFQALTEFRDAVRQIDPKATGNLFVVDQLLVGGVKRLPIAMAAILASLFLIVGLDLRSFRRSLLALVPLTVACIVAVGIVLAFRVPVSVLMLAGYPLLFGIGIDNGVHILHRAEESQGDLAKAVSSVGKAILFTAGTTAFGFSILFFLNHRGMEGLALVVVLGVVTCFLTSITVLPVLAARFGGK